MHISINVYVLDWSYIEHCLGSLILSLLWVDWSVPLMQYDLSDLSLVIDPWGSKLSQRNVPLFKIQTWMLHNQKKLDLHWLCDNHEL